MKRYSINEFIQKANKIHNNFYNYSKICYINSKTKIIIDCPHHGPFRQTPYSHLQGCGCPVCGGTQKLTLDKIQKYCKKLDLELVQYNYINSRIPIGVKCIICGWEGKITINSTHQRLSCPKCSQGLGERICREYFEQIFKKPFPSCFPKWLKGLQLDGYNEELGIAFEHQGRQHYNIGTFYSKTQDTFKILQKRDNKKIKLCKQNNIKLFIIPEIPRLTSIKDIKKIIRQQSVLLGIILPDYYNNISVDISRVRNIKDIDRIEEQQKLAKLKDGKCISTQWFGWGIKLLYECKNKHKFYTTPSHIKYGNGWCEECKDIKANRAIVQYDLKGNFIQQFNTLKEAYNILKISHIRSCCEKERQTAGGYMFKYKKECTFLEKSDAPVYKNHRGKVAQYDLNGNLIQIFLSQIDASRKTGISCRNISNCCNGWTKTAKGFVWENIKD
jgi:hypothetical protein